MNKIKISIKGKDGTGKSTVLVVLAQHLGQLGYDVIVPKHLVGLAVSESILNAGMCKLTKVEFEEVSKSSNSKLKNPSQHINQHINLLGMRVEDKVTGFKGVVSSISFDLYGCIQAIVNPGTDKEGKPQDSQWFDISRLTAISGVPVMDQPNFESGKQAEGKQGPAEKPKLTKP